MNEHLPECPVEKRLRAGKTVGSQTCICRALRACEVRVKQVCKDTHATLGLKDITRIAAKGYDMGERDALAAARAAVEAMDIHGCQFKNCIVCNCIGPQVIAAINALRKEES